jgi:AraC family transcriptional regulator
MVDPPGQSLYSDTGRSGSFENLRERFRLCEQVAANSCFAPFAFPIAVRIAATVKVELLPVERLLFSSELTLVGQFDCAVKSPFFTDSGPAQNYLVVFPRTSVEIRHDSRAAFVSTPTNVNFYNKGQKYVRHDRIGDDDRCDWIAIAPQVLSERIPAKGSRFFSRASVIASPATFAMERRYVRDLTSGSLDSLEAEERAIRIVNSALEDASISAGEREVTALQRSAVEDAKALLASSKESDQSLGSIARTVGISPFHLCRSFSRVTGVTLVRYRTELRLRRALDDFSEARRSLTEIALDYGFSSHAHFTSAFTRSFGAPPSRLLS